MWIIGIVLLSLLTGLLLGPLLGRAAEEQSFDPELLEPSSRDSQIARNRLLNSGGSAKRERKESVAHLN